MLTLLLIIFPLLSSLLLLAGGERWSKSIALVSAIIELLLAFLILATLKNGDTASLAFNCPWISSMGISFNIAIDGISMLLVLITCLLTPIIVYASFNRTYTN